MSLSGRKTVSCETKHLNKWLKEQFLLCDELYSHDYRRKAYVDVHVTWVDWQFTRQHVLLAVCQRVSSFLTAPFSSEAHTAEIISSAVNGSGRVQFIRRRHSSDDQPRLLPICYVGTRVVAVTIMPNVRSVMKCISDQHKWLLTIVWLRFY